MADLGQYSMEDIANRLRPRKGSGVCIRCGAKTRTKEMFGMTICNACWKKQTGR
jgi:hypothetical protein